LSNPNNISFGLTDIQVSFLNRPCIVLTGNSSAFNCYFANDTSGNSLIPSGTGIPVVNIRGIGYAGTASVSPITVDIVLTNFSPSVAGPEGNIPASVVGSGFPVSNDNNEVVISLCGNLATNYTSFSNTRIRFLIPPQGSTCSANGSSIKIHTKTYPLTFAYDATISPLVSSLSLSSASPIIKQTLRVSGSNFNSVPDLAVFLYDNSGVQQYELTIINATST
jgi:hypothetical protein